MLSYWDTLKDEKRPIVLYGTGNGADKILDACLQRGITVAGVFASDGFVRNRSFRGMRVLSYDEVRELFGDDIVVLPAFGTTRDEVIENFERLDTLCDLIIPEVPLYGGDIYDKAKFDSVRGDFEELYSMLSDDMSRELLSDAVMFRMTGKLKYLKRCESVSDSLASMPFSDDVVTCLDGGAFKGDSAQDMLLAFPNAESVIALEPDPNTFKKLEMFAAGTNGIVKPINVALGDFTGESDCVSSGSRGSGIIGRNRRAKNVVVRCDTVDRICRDIHLDFLKLDVEGFEKAALLGARETVCRDRCALAVSLYHRSDDITELPRLVRSMLGKCNMYLRRPRCIPMWDLTLYVEPK